MPRLQQVPQLEAHEREAGYSAAPKFTIVPGVTSEQIDVPELGYAEAARYGYALFSELRDQGVIAPATRFQVSLPTVTAGCEPFVAPGDQEAFEPAYARRLRAEADEILAAVPHADLAMQWDVAVEMGIVEGVIPAHFDDRFGGVVIRPRRALRVDTGAGVLSRPRAPQGRRRGHAAADRHRQAPLSAGVRRRDRVRDGPQAT